MSDKLVLTLLSIALLIGAALFAVGESHVRHIDGKHTFFLLNGEVNYPALTDIISKLAVATADDSFEIYIDSPGGDAAAGVAFTHALRNTKAHVTYAVPFFAASAVTLPLCDLPKDSIHVDDASIIIIHQIQLVIDGVQIPISQYKGDDTLLNTLKVTSKTMLAGCYKFLTKQQAADIENGKDLYLTGEQFNELKK